MGHPHHDLRPHLRPPDGQGRTRRAARSTTATGVPGERVTHSRSGPAPARTSRSTATRSHRSPLTEPEPPMFRRLQHRVAAEGRVGHGAASARGGSPVRRRQLRRRRVHARAVRRVSDQPRALRELHRVLRPGGELCFLEHVRSDEPRLARKQDRMNPLQPVPNGLRVQPLDARLDRRSRFRSPPPRARRRPRRCPPSCAPSSSGRRRPSPVGDTSPRVPQPNAATSRSPRGDRVYGTTRSGPRSPRRVWSLRETDRVGTSAPTGMPRVAALWRYPVKSFQGEPIPEGAIDEDGLRGDRCWGVRDEATGRILTARREPRLLLASAVLTDDGLPEITIPDGQRVRGTGVLTDSALSAWLGRPVTLVPAQGAPGATAEFFADATDDTSAAIEWTMPAGRFVDAMALLVLTTSSLRAGAEVYPAGDWHPRRFRPNVLVDIDGDSWIEDEWCGRTVQVATVEVLPRGTLHPLHDGDSRSTRSRTRSRDLQDHQAAP